MIVFRNVSKVYNMGGEQVRALWNANIHIKQGEFVAVVGPSGSGKSTLMNIVGCLDVASSGQYLLDVGRDLRIEVEYRFHECAIQFYRLCARRARKM